MGNDLHGGAEVFAPAFLADHRLVNPSRGDVVLLGQRPVYEPFIVAQVEIGLGAIIGDIHLTVLERRHRPGIHVDIRIEFLHRHPETAFDQQPA
jgi:hypothetical protein